jgi:hypothetical protein
MSTEQLTAEVMALPMKKRASLAQALWQSLGADLPEGSEAQAIREALRRDRELTTNKVKGRTHGEVMKAAKQALHPDYWRGRE